MSLNEYINEPGKTNEEELLELKEVKVKGILDKMIAVFGKAPKSLATIVPEYIKMEKLLKDTKVARDKLNEEIKVNMKELFSAEASVLTRVMQTAEFTVSLSKEFRSAPKEYVDYDKIFEELNTYLTPELTEMLELIKAKYTRLGDAGEIQTKLTVEPTKESALREGLVSNIINWIKKFSHQAKLDIHSALEDYDAHLERLKDMR